MIFYQAVQMIKKAIAQKDPQELVIGAIASVAFVQQLRKALPVCESVDSKSANWTDFDSILEVVEDPEDHMRVIGHNIVMNGVAITEDMAAAVEAFETGDFKAFGSNLGNALMKATEPSEQMFLY